MNHKDAKHFTWDQRLTLERMLKKGFTKAAIASALGKCERSIYYEINRGLCVQQTSGYEFIEVYCPEVAERRYREFLKEKGRDLKIGKDHALARRLEELLGEFFDITRMDLDSGPGERQPIQLSMLLEQLADEFYPLFAEKQLRCTVEIQHHLVVLGDPDKLARVFDNVLRNAVSYSTPGGRVDIQAKTVGRQAEITIRNEGLEIPEGELANIFQKFYRLDAARSSRTGGAGLGLAIAKEIVESHGGNIRCESNGRLTSFVISLPLYKEVRHVFKRNRAGLSEPK